MGSGGGSLRSLRDGAGVHLAVGLLACLFVLSPALFRPNGFGPDYTNHIWLIWQQALAISRDGHPTLYLQTPDGIFEPFYAFYGGTLYAVVGGVSALIGTDHTYSVYVVSIGVAIALAYGGMWWLGRLLGLSRLVSHLPAFVTVTAAYYLSDAYARGAWPELVALSGVPMVLAGGTSLLTRPWRPGPVALFVVAMVVMTGSHNLTLFWSVLLIGLAGLAILLVAGRARPPLKRIGAVVGLAVVAAGINAWFLIVDVIHSADTQAWIQNKAFIEKAFSTFFYFDNLGVVLDPLRGTPAQSTTIGLAIAPPIAAFALSVALVALAWPTLGRALRWQRWLWLILMAAMVLLVVLMVMPASWWVAIGAPFADIQFPYRLAGFLLIAVAVQLAVSLRFAHGLSATRRRIAVGLSLLLVVVTVVQAAAQMYPGSATYAGTIQGSVHPREDAFANGPTTPPGTWYDPYSYADSSAPVAATAPERIVRLPVPSPGQTEVAARVRLPPGAAPVATNIAGGPYVARVGGLPVAGRTAGGSVVVKPPASGRRTAELSVKADAGTVQTIGAFISLVCLLAVLCLLVALTVRPRLRYRRDPV